MPRGILLYRKRQPNWKEGRAKPPPSAGRLVLYGASPKAFWDFIKAIPFLKDNNENDSRRVPAVPYVRRFSSDGAQHEAAEIGLETIGCEFGGTAGAGKAYY